MSKEENLVSPVAPSERIITLDVLRGFALLGILIVNIQSFSMVEAAYFNPTAFGDLTGLNKLVWLLTHTFADLKFMTIFAILFGAGIVLMTKKIEARNPASAGVFYRRTFGLIIIGIMHAYLLWYGDILVWYGLSALVVFLFRKKTPRFLLTLGLISLSIPALLFLFSGWSMQFWPPEVHQEMLRDWKPALDLIEQEVANYQGSWIMQMEQRVSTAFEMHTFVFFVWALWRAGGLMLIGMALYKWGVLTAERPKSFYLMLMGVGFGIGLTLVIYGITQHFKANWSLDYSRFIGYQFNYWGSLFVSLGYISVIIFICKSGILNKLAQAFAAVGRLALTNYLFQTIICTTIFYGHGFGLFGQIERSGQILIVVLIWILQLTISSIWLRYFRFGPFEWVWRSFTYLKFQKIFQTG